MSILAKLLQKRGIKSADDLKPEERVDFDRWNKVLSSEGEVTVQKIADFCRGQKKLIEAQWRSFDNAPLKNERLVLTHTVYSAILEAIEAPQKERENLERHLNQLLNS